MVSVLKLAILVCLVAMAMSKKGSKTTTTPGVDDGSGWENRLNEEPAHEPKEAKAGKSKKGKAPKPSKEAVESEGGEGDAGGLHYSETEQQGAQAAFAGLGAVCLVAGVSFFAVRKYRLSRGYQPVAETHEIFISHQQEALDADESTPLVV